MSKRTLGAFLLIPGFVVCGNSQDAMPTGPRLVGVYTGAMGTLLAGFGVNLYREFVWNW